MPQITARVRAGYAMGSFVTGAFGTVPGLLLLPYLTDSLAVPAAVAGLLVLAPKAWDVLFNPVAGRISDRAGARRPFLLRGGVAVAVLFAALFAGPFTGAPAAVYVAVVFLLCATAYAFFQVPYVAMAAEITEDYDERTRLMAWRMAFLALAILVSGAGAPAVRDLVGGYPAVGVAVGALILIGTVATVAGTRGVPASRRVSTAATPRELVAAVRESRPFRLLLAVFVVQAVGLGTMLAGVDYFARLVLGDRSLQTLLFVGFVGPALVVMPLWQRVGRRRGKRFGLVAASLLFAVAVAGLGAARALPVAAVLGLMAVVGVGYAGMQVFPLAMLPDVITAQEQRSGATRAGLFSGVWTAGETLGLALGPGVYGLVLAVGGYVASTDGAAVQSPGAVSAALIGFTAIPAVLAVVALPLLPREESA
ncbi:Na+/melibiose symporter-like transporter [Saccharothrix tamanrassetensis]|uniref:Na+/melibiose symporter-like transporter n=1 Tax=Saccharothrix tamanrassetensis TaxID=1051531 RepID=A0A841CLN9_9PSEU|nr:MFS transporter [Saccharothrix tamanrassetensis]MBB5958020.1 Na+/melibiose symporter-like transporter [Saccharothrix tamanrassetensis]